MRGMIRSIGRAVAWFLVLGGILMPIGTLCSWLGMENPAGVFKFGDFYLTSRHPDDRPLLICLAALFVVGGLAFLSLTKRRRPPPDPPAGGGLISVQPHPGG
jgi:hypothetical protein